MGKSGAALRAAKKRVRTYTFTAEELEKHDQLVKECYQKICLVNMREKFDQNHDALRDEAIAMVVNCCLRVMVEDMGFSRYRDSRSRIARFAPRVLEEVKKVTDGDISAYKYMLQTDAECGVVLRADHYEEEET